MIGIVAGNEEVFRRLIRKLNLDRENCLRIYSDNRTGRQFERIILTCGYRNSLKYLEVGHDLVRYLERPGEVEEIGCCDRFDHRI